MGKWKRIWDDKTSQARARLAGGLASAATRGMDYYLNRVNAKAPDGFKLADPGKCEDCDRAWHTLRTMTGKIVPDIGFSRVMVSQTVLKQIESPLGLANLWKDHCEGCRKNHLEGLV